MKFHLMMCKSCRNFGRQMRLLDQASSQHFSTDDQSVEALPQKLSAQARQRIHQKIEGIGKDQSL